MNIPDFDTLSFDNDELGRLVENANVRYRYLSDLRDRFFDADRRRDAIIREINARTRFIDFYLYSLDIFGDFLQT